MVIVYREVGEILKGGFMELGAALACGVPIIAVGLEEFTIGKSGRVQNAPTLDFALNAAKRLLKPLEVQQ